MTQSFFAAVQQAEKEAKDAKDVEKHAAPESAKPHPTELTEEDVFTAWQILSPAGHSVLTKSQVLDSLKLFFPHISAREVRDLVGQGNLSVDKLRDLLFEADVPKFDANVEAFKIIDPHGTGYVDVHILKRLLLQLPGVDMVDDADLQLIMQIADTDKDGRISYQDFAAIGSWMPPMEQPTEATRKILLERLKREEQH